MAALDALTRLWKMARKVEDLFEIQTRTETALEALNHRFRDLEDRMTRLEANQRQVVTEARTAAAAAATGLASAIISDTVTRLTRIEMRIEAAELKQLPPSPQ